MTRKGDRFGRGGCYTCLACGKKTRDTGHDEAGVELCRKCYDEAGAENRRADGLDKTVTAGMSKFSVSELRGMVAEGCQGHAEADRALAELCRRAEGHPRGADEDHRDAQEN